jgi:hypothetical protein
MSFRVGFGESINLSKDGTRDDYEMVGWFKDEAFTEPFNLEAFELNDTTVTTPYDKTEPTELDQY